MPLLVNCRTGPSLERRDSAGVEASTLRAAALPSTPPTPAPLPAASASAAAPSAEFSSKNLQVGLSGAYGGDVTLGGACEVGATDGWELRLYPRQPIRRHVRALVAFAAKLRATLRCGANGEVYLTLSTVQARTLLGAHASLRCVLGAGNGNDAPGWFAEVSPPGFVPPELAPHVRALEFDTDEKLDLVRDLGACDQR